MPVTRLNNSLKRLVGAIAVASLLAAAPAYAVDGGGGGGGGSSDSDSPSASEPSAIPSLDDARALIRAKKWKTAVTMLKTIVRAEPNNAEANNLLGYSLRKSGDFKNARGFYLKALKLAPSHKGAHEYLGELYVEIGQMDKANEMLKALERLCGNRTCEEYEDLAGFIAAKS